LVLQNNAGNNLNVAASGAFTFSTALASGAAYGVTVLTQPSNPSQTCTITSGSGSVGSANVTSVQLTCSTNSYSVGGTVSGLDAADTGLVLQNNAGNDLTISANGAFSFTTPVASGASYAVTVKTQPSTGPLQTCSVTSGSGTVASAAIASVAVTCVTKMAKFLYVANQNSANVSAYSINASSGALTEIAGSPFTTAPTPRFFTLEPSGKFLYVTTLGSGTEPPRISGFAWNGTSGVLSELATSPFALSVASPPPAGAIAITPPAVHASGAFGYLSVPIPNGIVYGATIDSATGELNEIPGMPLTVASGTTTPTFDAAGKFLFVPASPGSVGQISSYQVSAPSGVLTPIGTFPTGGSNPFATLTPDGKFLLVPNGLSPNFAVLAVDAVAGTLSPVSGSPFATGPAGTGTGIPMYHRRLSFIYVMSTSTTGAPPPAASLWAFAFNTSTGAMTPLAGSPYTSNGATLFPILHPSGKFLYQVNGATGSLQRYAIDQVTGVPTLQADVTTPASAPFVLIPDPSGKYVYVTSSAGNNVSSYSVDQATGALTLVNSVPSGTAPFVPTPVGLQ
jgi:6-phosphogluconolactonase (cycloisomerase 2 family)